MAFLDYQKYFNYYKITIGGIIMNKGTKKVKKAHAKMQKAYKKTFRMLD